MADTPALKGFDSYDLKLGDELRGERASKGKTLLDVQRDLRIRADYIDAIENADASAFPFAGFAAGYVRSYARYLGLDADDVYRRFCIESGFEGVENSASVAPSLHGGPPPAYSGPVPSAAPIETKFMPSAVEARRMEIGASLRGVASIAVLAALVVGLGYGGWSVLQNIQRVGFAPLPTAPTVQVSAPDFLSPEPVETADAMAEQGADVERVTLAALYAAQEPIAPSIEPRDGPIASIDPETAGVYAPPPGVIEPDAQIGAEDELASVDAPLVNALASFEQVAALDDPIVAEAAPEIASVVSGVSVFAKDEAWVRVRDGESGVLFTGILGAGEQFPLPGEVGDPTLRAGNAGSVYIIVNGEAFGPLGAGPEVAKGVVLTPEAVRSAYPLASDVAVAPLKADDREASLQSDVALNE